MQILSTQKNRLTLRNKGQISRRDRYRADVKVSEQDRRDQLAIKWDPSMVPSSLLRREGDRYTVSNFRWGWEESGQPAAWKPRHSDTTIDTSKVKDVYLTVEPFKPEIVAGHGLVIFEMKDDGAVESATGEKDFGLAFSVEARRPEGETYGLVKGMKKSFGMIFQLGSLSDQIQKTARQRGSKLVLHKLTLNEEQKKEMLRNALDSATQDRMGEWYHTLTNSCFTECVDLVNSVVPEEQKMARWTRHLKLVRPATSLPALAGASVRQQGLLADGPITVLNPDAAMHPGKQESAPRGLKKTIAEASRSALWRPGFRLAGMSVGGAAGLALGVSLLGDAGSVVSTATGLLGGAYLGDRLSDVIAVNTDRAPQDAAGWYTARGGISAEEAARRLSNAD